MFIFTNIITNKILGKYKETNYTDWTNVRGAAAHKKSFTNKIPDLIKH